MHKLFAALLLAPLLVACTKEPPKCSDPETTTLVKEIILDKLGVDAAGRAKIGMELLDSILTLENTRPSAYEEKIKKVSCQATLLVDSGNEAGTNYKLPLNFESQLDDKNNHIVAVTGLMTGDLRQVDLFLALGIENARKKNGTPEAAPAQAAAPAAAAEPTQAAAAPAEQAADEGQAPDTVEQSGICKGLDMAVNVEHAECVGRKFALADKQLNERYQRVMAALGADRQAELRSSQRDWIKEKDQKCDEAGKEFEGGTLQPIVISDCEVRMTEERTAFLASYE